MKTNQQTRRGFTLVELLVVIVIIASLAGLTAPMVIRQRKKADQTEAVNNSKQIGLAMFEFENEYGSFPSASTASQLTVNFPPGDNPGQPTADTTDANGFYRQLFIAGITQSEQMFYAKTGISKKPDGKIQTSDCLAAGEVGFGYITNGVAGLTTAGNPARVICATPLIADGTKFNPDPFDKKAVLLRIDNSASSVNINASGEAMVSGASLMTASATNMWGSGVTPTMHAPSPAP